MRNSGLPRIAAVEQAWGNVAHELNRDSQEVIDATHGRRAIDNLRDLKPALASTPDNESSFASRLLVQL